MKKLLFLGVLMITLVGGVFYFASPNMYVYAEGVFTETVYTYADEDATYTITLISEDRYLIDAVRGTDEMSFIGTYQLEDNTLTLFTLEEPLIAFEIQEDNTLVMIDDEYITDEQEELDLDNDYAETEESNYFREVVMPYITANISGILSAALAIIIMLGKLKAATDELKSSNSINSTLKKENTTLRADVKNLQTEVEELKKDTKATKEMVKIGFCNTSELVENGFAEEIARVGENEETN